MNTLQKINPLMSGKLKLNLHSNHVVPHLVVRTLPWGPTRNHKLNKQMRKTKIHFYVTQNFKNLMLCFNLLTLYVMLLYVMLMYVCECVPLLSVAPFSLKSWISASFRTSRPPSCFTCRCRRWLMASRGRTSWAHTWGHTHNIHTVWSLWSDFSFPGLFRS